MKSNADEFEVSYEEELHRIIIHGILHLCGINDKGPGEREIMTQKENEALALCLTKNDLFINKYSKMTFKYDVIVVGARDTPDARPLVQPQI